MTAEPTVHLATMTTATASLIVDGGSCSAAVIKAGTELSKADLSDALNLVGFGWSVQTRTLGPTNTKGTRIKASFSQTRSGHTMTKTISRDYSLDFMQDHLRAALAFLGDLDNGCTNYKLVASMPTEEGYAFAFR